ncbi:hypothetical protein [Methylobacterium sp.]|uniref:hypothetical protein n=1 Tax=Methylobacterium sp. TaxID=409 RepID=UPI000C61673E|nr:hypothetical protein [Methylobacterium sp.]MBP33249.1 hypothetical protein [Methylobacterium sp.]
MAEIRQLKAGSNAYNQHTIDKLEEALALAKEGRMLEVALVGTMNTRAIFTSCSGSDDVYRLVGAMEQLKHELLNDKMLGHD